MQIITQGTVKGSFYRKSLILVLIITCLPVTLISIGLYYTGSDRIVEELNKAHQIQLKQSIQRLDDYLSHLELYSAQLGFNPGFDKSLAVIDFHQQFQRTNDLLRSLSLMKDSNPLISSVVLYLKDSDKVIGDDSGVRTIPNEQERAVFQSLLRGDEGIYWVHSIHPIHRPESNHHGVIIKLPGGTQSAAYGAFIIYINQSALNNMVQRLTSGAGVAFLIDDHDQMITDSSKDFNEIQGLEEALKAYVRHDNLHENTFVYDWQGQSFSVSYGKLAKLGTEFTYISATPLSQIMAPVSSMVKTVLLVSGFGLFMALLLSWFASKKIYDPIRRLAKVFHSFKDGEPVANDELAYIERQWKRQLEKSEQLYTKVKQSVPNLREGFLLQLLEGHLYYLSDQELALKMKELDWSIENKQFVFFVMQLHGMSSFDTAFSEKDKQLISYAASNIVEELCSAQVELFHVINYQDLSVGLFLMLDSSMDSSEIKDKLANDFMSALNNVLRMTVTLVISKATCSIGEIPGLAEQTRQALRYREIGPSNQRLDMDDFLLAGHQPVRFPFELEREIVHAFSIGMEEETMMRISQFMQALQKESSTELMVHQGLMKLLGSMWDAILKSGTNPYTLYQGADLYEQLQAIREPEEMLDWFRHKLVAPFIQTLSLTYDPELKSAIDRLLLKIQEEYLSDISLEGYAEQLQMSPFKLSRAFKQMTGQNYVDYVTKLRMEKCKELLLTTDLKIGEIAEKLRYQPSHLIRLFKKSEELTPGQYREKHSH
ncbi:helix-turn-helix transcriptional regulator [Paenibacillus sp. J2TS4]|uniref:helix-turn-helix transcriptional regulator n=1 Tax=Paenibacillus sp. J2TS4 TaxID=2807194 RepID=UPI001B286A1C|nr:helix-turn-helix transcriptional regulator [Paenibacillus sp. J2TS4]GIP31516.1 HTH-type transcriptional regulator YesS [Paenibacillus sp. J2TS4]